MNRVPTHRIFVFVAVAVSGVSWDLYSKNAVFDRLGYPGRSSAWMEHFFDGWVAVSFHTNFNEGALWGMGQGLTWLFASLSFVAAAGMLYWLFFRGAAHSLWLTMCLGLIMAGTLGNLWDRLGWHQCVVEGRAVHAVRDFLLFTFGAPDLPVMQRFHWPVFNFADVFLVTGAIMLVLRSFYEERPRSAAKTGTHSEPATIPLQT